MNFVFTKYLLICSIQVKWINKDLSLSKLVPKAQSGSQLEKHGLQIRQTYRQTKIRNLDQAPSSGLPGLYTSNPWVKEFAFNDWDR